MSESLDELMEGLDVNTSNDIAIKEIKYFKRVLIKSIDKFNSYIKLETKNNNNNNNNNNEPDIKQATCDDIKAYIIDKQKLIKKRYKSLIETKKTIKNNDGSVYNALKKLHNESQLKLIELIRLDTLLNDSINVIQREICKRNKKNIKKIDINKIKNVDTFIHKLINVINNKKQMIRTLVIVKLNRIISDIKEKSKMNHDYNYNDRDKLLMIYNDLNKYIKNHLKKDIGSIKAILKTVSDNQTDSHKTLMELLN